MHPDGYIQITGTDYGGTINGVAGYSFKIVMIDGKSAGSPDRVRIKVWNTATGAFQVGSKS